MCFLQTAPTCTGIIMMGLLRQCILTKVHALASAGIRIMWGLLSVFSHQIMCTCMRRNSNDVGAVVANRPVPRRRCIYYYEVRQSISSAHSLHSEQQLCACLSMLRLPGLQLMLLDIMKSACSNGTLSCLPCHIHILLLLSFEPQWTRVQRVKRT